MNQHALSVLEFPRVLDDVAGRAVSEPGAARVRALHPSADRQWIHREHSRVAAVRALRAGEPPLGAERVPPMTVALDRLRIAGLSWRADELRDARLLLQGARRTREALRDEKRPPAPRAVLSALGDRLFHDKTLATALDKAIADDATVNDNASPALRRVRRELRASEGELVKVLERQLAKLDDSLRVPDMSVTVRNGRYVIPVRREGRSAIGGIVHDASATGATVFVEPPAAIEFSNRLRELEAEEREEVERVLAELTEMLRPHRDALLASLDALSELDSLHARAAWADALNAGAPLFNDPSAGWAIVGGKHPLLLAGGVDAVPFDLAMDASERTLVVSGPNTGGKTVLLKAVGLLSAMAQSGIPPTAAPGSAFAVFDDYFADIGDEQSIEASLSTFSAHLRNLAEILESATASSLVLIDELGSGTDPLEGAALGWAILEALTERGTSTLASSHLGALKELATQVASVVNGSLQFDEEHLAPTYRFSKGVPGRSYGISIARRLRLPEEIVARAEARVPRAERETATLLQRLEVQRAMLASREAELAELLDDAKRRNLRISARENSVREREREVERQSREEARKYLLNARAEIERTVRELRKAGSDDVADKARLARQQTEQLAGKHAEALELLDAEERDELASSRRPKTKAGTAAVVVGDFATVATLGGKRGRILEVRGTDALVTVGSMKVTVPLAALVKDESGEPVAAAPVRGDVPDAEARGEVDLRGLRVDEMEPLLFRAIDDAIRADLPALRIIHGKGTGALRDRVTEMLKKDTRVKQFRLGGWTEGGSGVTMADLQ
ncbi:MAG: endonuclease MutS2 [Gemmatimonadota bacterium]